MPPEPPRIDGIDHVALGVPDRQSAADWYEEVLGMTPREEYELWADRGGPLVISGTDHGSSIALFGTETEDPGPLHLAFGVDGSTFLEFIASLSERQDVAVDGPADVVDHDLSLSVYFTDPFGHDLEVTTYDYDQVAGDL